MTLLSVKQLSVSSLLRALANKPISARPLPVVGVITQYGNNDDERRGFVLAFFI